MHACTMAENGRALVAPTADGDVSFPGAALFLPFPFLRNFVMELEYVDPSEIVLLLFVQARRFDIKHADNEAYKDTVLSHAEDFAL